MTTDSTKPAIITPEGEHFLCDDWFDPLETGVRTRIRGFIEEVLEAELARALGRDRYERPRRGDGDSPGGRRRLPAWPSGTGSDGNLWVDNGPCAAGAASDPRWQDGRVAECDHSSLPTAHEAGRRSDYRRLSVRDQHTPGAPCAGGAVRRRSWQRHGQPGMAQDERRLGRLERPFAR